MIKNVDVGKYGTPIKAIKEHYGARTDDDLIHPTAVWMREGGCQIHSTRTPIRLIPSLSIISDIFRGTNLNSI